MITHQLTLRRSTRNRPSRVGPQTERPSSAKSTKLGFGAMAPHVCVVVKRVVPMLGAAPHLNQVLVVGNQARTTRPLSLHGGLGVEVDPSLEAVGTTYGTSTLAGTPVLFAHRTMSDLSATITHGHIAAMITAITSSAIPSTTIVTIVEHERATKCPEVRALAIYFAMAVFLYRRHFQAYPNVEPATLTECTEMTLVIIVL